MSAHYDVTFAGQFVGEAPCRVVNFDLTGVTHSDYLGEAQERCVADAVTKLPKGAVWVDLVGSAHTIGWIDNPHGLATQVFSRRYVGPHMAAMHRTSARLLCVVTDMCCYPRNYEMLWWPECRPLAVLGQETVNRHGRFFYDWRLHTQCAYARAENWFSYGLEARKSSGHGCVIVAHSHLRDPRWNKGRLERWNWLLAKAAPCRVYGLGWEGWERDGVEFLESRRDAFDLGAWGACLPPARGFSTTKVRKYLLAGAPCYVWDDYPDTVPRQLREWGGPVDVAECLEATAPDFSLLDEAIQCLADGREDHERFGGYDIRE